MTLVGLVTVLTCGKLWQQDVTLMDTLVDQSAHRNCSALCFSQSAARLRYSFAEATVQHLPTTSSLLSLIAFNISRNRHEIALAAFLASGIFYDWT